MGAAVDMRDGAAHGLQALAVGCGMGLWRSVARIIQDHVVYTRAMQLQCVCNHDDAIQVGFMVCLG